MVGPDDAPGGSEKYAQSLVAEIAKVAALHASQVNDIAALRNPVNGQSLMTWLRFTLEAVWWLSGVVVRLSDLRLTVMGSNPGHGIAGFF